MPTKPTDDVSWSTSQLDLQQNGQPIRKDIPENKVTIGYQYGEQPDAAIENEMKYRTAQWISYFTEVIENQEIEINNIKNTLSLKDDRDPTELAFETFKYIDLIQFNSIAALYNDLEDNYMKRDDFNEWYVENALDFMFTVTDVGDIDEIEPFAYSNREAAKRAANITNNNKYNVVIYHKKLRTNLNHTNRIWYHYAHFYGDIFIYELTKLVWDIDNDNKNLIVNPFDFVDQLFGEIQEEIDDGELNGI